MAELNQERQRVRIRLKAYDHKVLDESVKKIMEAASRTGAVIHGPIPLPTKRHLTTVLRSPHIYKDSRDQYQMLVHKRLIDVVEPSNKTIDALMNLNLPAGVDVEVKM